MGSDGPVREQMLCGVPATKVGWQSPERLIRGEAAVPSELVIATVERAGCTIAGSLNVVPYSFSFWQDLDVCGLPLSRSTMFTFQNS